MTEIVLRPQTPEDAEGVTAVFGDRFPQFPHATPEEYRQSVDGWGSRGLLYRQWVAQDGGAIVGVGLVITIESEEEGLFYLEVTVPHDRGRQGIGTAIFERLLSHRTELGYRRTLGWIHDGDEAAAAFTEKHRYRANGASEQNSRLAVAEANISGFENIEDKLSEDGLRIESLAGYASDDAFMRKVHRVDMDAHADVPSSVPWKDIPYDDWILMAVHGPGRSPEWAWVALDGDEPVGLARLRVYSNRCAGNAFTGVLATYRGRGVARALKYRTVAWSRENDIDFIYTGNEVANTRMLAINISLGYQKLPRAIEVERIFAQD